MNKRITKIDIIMLLLSNQSEQSLLIYKNEVAPILEKIYLISNDSEKLTECYNEILKLYNNENNKV